MARQIILSATIYTSLISAFIPAASSAGFTIQVAPVSAPALPAGSRVQFQATVSPATPGLWYRFRVRPAGGVFSTVVDFSAFSNGVFYWSPMEEGDWQIEATAKQPGTQETAATILTYQVTSRITGTSPVVNAISTNTMMALVSVPPCVSGSVRVNFWPTSNPDAVTSTRSLLCKPGKSLNFLIAGMLANTQYTLRHQAVSGFSSSDGPTLTFTTGGPPPGFPAATVSRAPDSATSVQDKVVFEVNLAPSTCLARDLGGNLLWYYNTAVHGPLSYCLRPVIGGTILLLPAPPGQFILREVDLAGNTLKETNVSRISEQLVGMGRLPIIWVHHDAVRLPNGYTAVLTGREQMISGVNTLGDGIVVLDTEFQVAWAWDSFEKLNPAQGPVLGENCVPMWEGCPVFTGPSPAVDWTHSNSIFYTSDGHFIVSHRNLDLVTKINYANGAGNGDVIWKLGPQGDIALTNPGIDAFPFNSHQHFATMKGNRLWLYDNGNTRVARFGGSNRGQVYVMNEAAKTATLELNVSLPVNSLALGSAQRLSNGNYSFGAGELSAGRGVLYEVVPNPLPAGTLNYQAGIPAACYRRLRMRDLYTYLD
jgi:hypothetical protein